MEKSEKEQEETPVQRGVTMEWDGPDDAENPRNWRFWKKAYHTSIAASHAFTVTFMSSIYASGYKDVSRRFNVSSTVSLLGVSLFCLGLAFGPVLAAPLSETRGRSIVYRISLPISILFNVGSAVSDSMETLAVCRFFAGFFGSPALSLGGGTIADIWDQGVRGLATALFVLAPNLGPGLGPVIGGFVNESKGWRWLEWVIVFISLAVYVWSLFISETYKKTILERRAKRRGLLQPREKGSLVPAIKAWARNSMGRPLVMLVTEPIVLFFSLYVALNFGILYNLFAAVPLVFEATYGFNGSQVGLVFISVSIGCLLATATAVAVDVVLYQRRVGEARDKGRDAVAPEHRLYTAMIGSFGLPIGLFWFAWTARGGIHWAGAVIATLPFAWGNLCIFTTAVLYMLDSYGPAYGASAMSANGFARYVFAAAFPLFTIQMYERLGTQWATSLLGFFSLAMLPIPWVLFKWGEKVRGRNAKCV